MNKFIEINLWKFISDMHYTTSAMSLWEWCMSNQQETRFLTAFKYLTDKERESFIELAENYAKERKPKLRLLCGTAGAPPPSVEYDSGLTKNHSPVLITTIFVASDNID